MTRVRGAGEGRRFPHALYPTRSVEQESGPGASPTNGPANPMKVSIEKNELVIRIELSEPKPSGSGKNLIVASTHGNVKTDVLHPKSKRPLTISLNAYYKPE